MKISGCLYDGDKADVEFDDESLVTDRLGMARQLSDHWPVRVPGHSELFELGGLAPAEVVVVLAPADWQTMLDTGALACELAQTVDCEECKPDGGVCAEHEIMWKLVEAFRQVAPSISHRLAGNPTAQ